MPDVPQNGGRKTLKKKHFALEGQKILISEVGYFFWEDKEILGENRKLQNFSIINN